MFKTVPAFDRIGEENAFAVLARANALAAQGRDIINLGIGQPDFRTPDFIVEAAIKALRDGHHGYTPAVGIPPLREAVAADLGKRFKVEVSPDEVMILPGGKPTMFMSILMFGEPGADILYPDPGFPIYRSMIEYTGARPVPVPIREQNNFAFSAEETLGLITPETRLLIVNSPANPTGLIGQLTALPATWGAAGSAVETGVTPAAFATSINRATIRLPFVAGAF
jgi:aspartate/methionine/tyrosine aminotransferase